jgi:hypothetical protein
MPSATANYIQDKGYNLKAGEVVTKYRAVKFSAAEEVTPITGATDVPAGIAQFDVSAAELLKGKGVTVRTEGASLMEASEAITIGALVSITSNGRAQVAGAGERVIGIAREAASGAGKFASVMLDLPGTLVA